MKRVALIEPVGGHGGMEHYDLGLCRGLLHAGWSVSWYTCGETATASLPGLEIERVYQGIWGKAGKLQRAGRYLRGTLKALRSARRKKELLCHLQFFNGAPEELAVLLLSYLFRRTIVLTVHDVESFSSTSSLGSKVASFVYRLADALIVHNQTSRAELSKRLGIPVESISIIKHGNYIEALGAVPSRKAAKELLHLDPDRKTILFFGQIKQVKGLDLLLAAFSELPEPSFKLTLVIAGRPWKADFAPFQQKIQELGIASRCSLHIRYIDDAEVPVFYASADLIVLPYRRIYQSGVLLQAMSYARAVLVSDLPGMTEMIADGVNGFVFETGSSTSLAQALRIVMSDDETREQAAQRGFAYVQSQHDWDFCGEQSSLLYMYLLQKRGVSVN